MDIKDSSLLTRFVMFLVNAWKRFHDFIQIDLHMFCRFPFVVIAKDDKLICKSNFMGSDVEKREDSFG
jgi:hypothetical protein